MEKFEFYFPFEELLSEEEIAFYPLENGIYVPRLEVLKQISEAYGFRYAGMFLHYFSKNSLKKVICTYQDIDGNAIILETKPMLFEFEERDLKLGGFLTTHAYIYDNFSGSVKEINLKEYAKFLRKNAFDEVKSRLRKAIRKKIDWMKKIYS